MHHALGLGYYAILNIAVGNNRPQTLVLIVDRSLEKLCVSRFLTWKLINQITAPLL